jgi:FG-GAP-like repeat
MGNFFVRSKITYPSAMMFAFLMHLLMIPDVKAEIMFDSDPKWISNDIQCTTGGVIGDINSDGFLDLAISNGNDMAIESEGIYWGSTDGIGEDLGWISTDSSYSGHCALGDLNGDQLPEFVVGNYIESSSGFTESTCKIYYNTGSGLESLPSWLTADLNNTFRVTLADVDNDGDLDLACANGEAYSNRPQANEIYFNQDGLLDLYPGWISTDIDSSYDVKFSDFDRDGDLDLAVANSGSPTRIYSNFGTGLETTASWSSDEADNDNSLIWTDINGDLWQDLVVITNKQLQGAGVIKLFINTMGVIETTPSWIVNAPVNGYGSAVLSEDFDLDGDMDLAAGSWWGQVTIYENTGTELDPEPAWTSDNTFVVEVLATYKEPLTQTAKHCDVFTSGDFTNLIQIPSRPLSIDVRVNSVPLTPDAYCYDDAIGVVTFPMSFEIGSQIEICYHDFFPAYIFATSWGDQGAQGPNYGYRNVHPTPGPSSPALDLVLNAEEYHGGDEFICYVDIVNPDEIIESDFYTLLEIAGVFFFYPTWQEFLSYENLDIPENQTVRIDLFNFTLPPNIGYNGVIRLYSAVFFRGTYNLICDYDWEECSFFDAP